MRSGRADGMARVEGEVRAPSSETDSTRHSAVPGSRQGRAPDGWRQSAGPFAPSGERTRDWDFWRVALLSLGHGGSDVYSSILNPILPLFILSGRISLTEAGIISFLYA